MARLVKASGAADCEAKDRLRAMASNQQPVRTLARKGGRSNHYAIVSIREPEREELAGRIAARMRSVEAGVVVSPAPLRRSQRRVVVGRSTTRLCAARLPLRLKAW